eukprot:CAMPEP_0202443878 /NCGR_PEP_ID=MMETSP1360-20130828/3042_1 /ASSEMBLY_ACC=CAM_ASM_000848 /TAXON_ID=515479 /ORGANISM="Licmophora paradoxa, Strain CCMP2313" /LENGTH=345 /DNA_ID=CAMNT_0049059697 /DNA_START=48 /DNA_END=1085 /DNA_ORIENTATION=+
MAPFEAVVVQPTSSSCELSMETRVDHCVEGSLGNFLESDINVLKKSFQQLSTRGTDLLLQIAEHSSDSCIDSPTVDACRHSLRCEVSMMLLEADHLLQNVGQVTPWRASLAQLRAESYLGTIESALSNSARQTIDRQLRIVASAITDQLSTEDEEGEDEEKVAEQPPQITISSWRTPSLAFDVVVGKEICKSFPQVIVRARVIAEVLAKDMNVNGAQLPHYRACTVSVEGARYERMITAVNGNTGEVFLKLRISPVGRPPSGNKIKKGKKVWGFDERVTAVSFREARAVQLNAFPPHPKANVDIFTSVMHGSYDTTVTMRCNTNKSLQADAIPEIAIDLVLASSL